MRKLFILILGIFLVFSLVGVGFSNGNGDSDECTCTSVSCPSCPDYCTYGSITSSGTITIYFQFLGTQTFGPYNYKSPQDTFISRWCKCDECHCSCWCASYTYYCGNWGECIHSGCSCKDEYCNGWCLHKAKSAPNEVPVYDGPDFANCGGSAGGDCSTFGEKYERNSKTYSEATSCTCSWCTIRNYYECDSSQIDDSHPCSSENCAPDFVGGRNYCCDSEQCAHLGNVVSLSGYRYRDSSVNPDLYCYDSGSIVQYQGYKLKCNDGNWEFIGGNKSDFSDNCGKTIFNYPLFFNSPDNNFYPDGYGYKDSYAIYPVSFDGTKDIVASVIPDETVEINEESVRYKVFGEKTGEFDVKFKGDEEGNQFDLTVNCYTPDKYNCDSSHDDCWPGSYCSQDNPTNNFVSDDDIAKVKLGVRILNNNSDVKCWINGENILDETEFKDLVWSDEIALEDYNLIACKVEAKEANSGFDAKLYQTKTGGSYFDFGDIDGGIVTAPDCSISTKWRYTDSVSVDDWKNKFDYDDSSWEEKPQPFGSYLGIGCTKKPEMIYSPPPGEINLCDGVPCESLTSESWCTNPGAMYEYCCKWVEEGQTACTQDKLKTSGDILYLRKIIEPNYYFFCCPNNTCAHLGECYDEGSHRLTVAGEDGSPCLWNCKNNRWGKQQEGAECEKDCDCADSDENNCVPTLHDLSKKICCNIGECGLGVESRCTDDSYCCPSGHSTIYKGNLCQCNAGSWTCSNTAIKTDYSRILFSKNSNKHETTLEVSETELRDINSANAKVLVFFDKKDYDGDITITGLENCSSFISTTKPIDEKFEFDSSSILSTDKGLNCRLKIEAPGLDNDEYFFYTGSTLVLEYI